MRNYRHSKKHNEFPSFIDFLEGNDTGPFSRVSSDRIAKLTSFVLKLEYDELKILKTITTASIDAMDYLYNLENELDPAENEDESSEGWDEEEAEDSSDNNSGSADEADRDAEKLRRLLHANARKLQRGIYRVPSGAEFVFDEKDVLDPMIIIH